MGAAALLKYKSTVHCAEYRRPRWYQRLTTDRCNCTSIKLRRWWKCHTTAVPSPPPTYVTAPAAQDTPAHAVAQGSPAPQLESALGYPVAACKSVRATISCAVAAVTTQTLDIADVANSTAAVHRQLGDNRRRLALALRHRNCCRACGGGELLTRPWLGS